MPPLTARVLLVAVLHLVAAAAQPATLNVTQLCGAPPRLAPALRGNNGTNGSSGEGRRLAMRSASVHLHYDPRSAPQPGAWYMSLTPQESSEATYFSTNSHASGYMGLQQISRRWGWFGFSGQAIFSIWDAGCSPGQRAQVVQCGRGARCDRFGGEGTGVRTVLALDNWQLGRSYDFVVEVKDLGGGMVRYDGYVFAEELGGWNLLSKVAVSSAPYLYSMASFVEQWSGGGFGDMRMGRFGPSYIEQAGGAQGWTQLTSAEFSTSYGPEEDARTAYAAVTSGDPVEKWAMGNGGSLPQTQPYTVLDVQPSPYDLPGSLRQYIDMRSSGQLP